MFVIISHLWSFFLDIGFLFFTPRCCKVNYTIIFILKKRMKNTGYMSHYSAAQNEGKWSSRSSEKEELFIIPQLKSVNILQSDPAFFKAEIFTSGWDLLGSFSVCKLQNQDSPSKVCLPAKCEANASTCGGKSFADLCVINLLSTVPHCPTCKTGCKRPLVLGNTLIYVSLVHI